ncbi:MAG: DUF4862 family protein [Propionibacteriaceae bacterium]|jgi:hypothetical protein|nr:DUF4862 family protein [Propionibacteriaceae bacterium]
MADRVVLGAYASAPAGLEANPGVEARWYELVGQIEGAVGIEAPYRGGFHSLGAERFASLLPAGWSVYVATLPLSMDGVRKDARYGLASDDEGARAAAIADIHTVFEGVLELNDALGRDAVKAVHLTSAPQTLNAKSSWESMARSLETLTSWRWGSTQLVLEHADAPEPPLAVEKGFLPLAAEIQAILRAREATGVHFGQLLNWGRSAVEGRSPVTPLAHLTQAMAAGTLAGYFFSGASAVGGTLGAAWKDAHNPISSYDPSSLLTPAGIAQIVGKLPDHAYIGVKVADSKSSADIRQRVLALALTAEAVVAAVAGNREMGGKP